MARGMYKEWLTADNLLLLQGWKLKGLTDEQVAHNIGINPRTLERWKKDHSQICRALKKGKEHANYEVENALFNKATKDGNVTAMIFWLKNNYSEKYFDRSPVQPDNNDAQVNLMNELLNKLEDSI